MRPPCLGKYDTMTDNKQDDSEESLIDISDPLALSDVAKQLNVGKREILDAVHAIGNSKLKVEAYVKNT